MLPFETVTAMVATHSGGPPAGSVILQFFTPANLMLQTVIGPVLASKMVSMFGEAMAASPRPPLDLDLIKTGFRINAIPGIQPSGDGVATYFGQNYHVDLLQALGVLMIRANLLDHSLIRLFAELGKLTVPRAAAIFFSTVNMRGRLDMIRSLVDPAGLKDPWPKRVKSSLDEVTNIVKRRNHLVHGSWQFQSDSFVVRMYTPNNEKKKFTDVPISTSTILKLASEYRSANHTIAAIAASIRIYGPDIRKS